MLRPKPKQFAIHCKNNHHKLHSPTKKTHVNPQNIFNPTSSISLDILHNLQGHFLTKPLDIAKEIYQTQQIWFQRQAPLCGDITDHPKTYTCIIHKYPWHTHQGFILDKISNQFTREIHDNCIKWLTRGKTPSPNNIANNIFKALPTQCQDLLFLFINQCYRQNTIAHYWKHNKNILVRKKRQPDPLGQLQTNSSSQHYLQTLHQHSNNTPHKLRRIMQTTPFWPRRTLSTTQHDQTNPNNHSNLGKFKGHNQRHKPNIHWL